MPRRTAETTTSSRLTWWGRGVAEASAASLLALLFLLEFGSFRQPSTAHQFRGQSESCMALDQSDGAVAAEAAFPTPALRVWLQVAAPVFVAQPRFLPPTPDPLPQLRAGFTRLHARRGPPLSR